MAESKDYIISSTEDGSVNISEDVIAIIAWEAMREVEGFGGPAAGVPGGADRPQECFPRRAHHHRGEKRGGGRVYHRAFRLFRHKGLQGYPGCHFQVRAGYDGGAGERRQRECHRHRFR